MIARTALAAVITLSATAALADSVTGEVLAFDRKERLIIMQDKSVFVMPKGSAEAPENLKAGDIVTIQYDSAGEDGYIKINSIEIIE